MSVIIVGMADLNVCKSPGILTTLGLGSCVGVCIYDKFNKIGGMAHIMLPSSKGFGGQNRAKFADLAIIDLAQAMVKLGASRGSFTAKIAGGAHMFGGSSANVLKVGERNIAACLEVLNALKIPIHANDTGGSYGRTIELYTDTGALKVRSVGAGEKLI